MGGVLLVKGKLKAELERNVNKQSLYNVGVGEKYASNTVQLEASLVFFGHFDMQQVSGSLFQIHLYANKLQIFFVSYLQFRLHLRQV